MASICKKCTSEVKSNHNAVACDLCGKWYHAKCIGITVEAYKFLKACAMDASAYNSPPNNGGVMWFCYDCMGPASQMIKNISAIQKRQEDIEEELRQTNRKVNLMDLEMKENIKEIEVKAETRIAALERKCDSVEVMQIDTRIKQLEGKLSMTNSATKPRLNTVERQLSTAIPTPIEKEHAVSDEELIKFVVQEEINKKTAEERDLENRKRNIIIYRVPEKKTENVSERKTNDTVFVKDLLDGVFNMKGDENEIEKM